MKIGILTFHRAYNYGALLQTYALSSYLRICGHDVEVIDYFPSYFRTAYSLSSLNIRKKRGLKNKILSIIEYVLTHKTKVKRFSAFSSFYDYIPMSDKQYDEYSISLKSYDVVIWGSDQVWNPKLTHSDGNYVASMQKVKEQKFVSYAASTMIIGNGEEDNYYTRIIKNYDRVSVRETSLNEYLNRLVPDSSICVLDPVFLLKKDDWGNIAKTPLKKKRYVLLYTVPTHPRIREITKLIAQEKGLEVIELTANVRAKSDFDCDSTASPQEFIGYFLDAEFVVTTSFHGTAFSIIMGKQFFTILLDSVVDERALSLLSLFGLERRAIRVNDSIPSLKDVVNYNEIQDRIDVLCDYSKEYLRQVTE